jgi:hypothetical protein
MEAGRGIEGDCGRDGEGRDGRFGEGSFEQALKVAEGIEDALWRARALIEIAEEMAKAGMFGQRKSLDKP